MHAAPAGAEPVEKRSDLAARHGIHPSAVDPVQKIMRDADRIGSFPPVVALRLLPLFRERDAGKKREEFRARDRIFRLVCTVRVPGDFCIKIIDLLIRPMRVRYIGVLRRADRRAEQQRRKDQKQDITCFHVRLPSLSVPPGAAAPPRRPASFR